MVYTPPAEYPFEDSPSTDTPVYAATLNDIVESLVDLDAADGRVADLESGGANQPGRAAALALILGV